MDGERTLAKRPEGDTALPVLEGFAFPSALEASAGRAHGIASSRGPDDPISGWNANRQAVVALDERRSHALGLAHHFDDREALQYLLPYYA